MTPFTYPTEVDSLRQIAVAKLQQLGTLGDELAAPPDGALPEWTCGTLLATEALTRDLSIVQQAIQLLIREGYPNAA